MQRIHQTMIAQYQQKPFKTWGFGGSASICQVTSTGCQVITKSHFIVADILAVTPHMFSLHPAEISFLP